MLVIKPGSYGTSPLHSITKPSAFKYSEQFYLILFPKTSLKDHLLHLTLMNHCFRQQSTRETHVAWMNRVQCCSNAPQMLCTNSTQFLHTHKQKPYLQAFDFLFYTLLWRWAHTTLFKSQKGYVSNNKWNAHTFTTHIINPSQHEVHLNKHRTGGDKTGSIIINLKLRGVHEATVPVEKQAVIHILRACL